MNNPLLRNWCVLYFMIKALNVIVLLSAHAPFTAVCTANLKLLVLTSKIPIRYANVLSYANGIMHLASGYDVFGIYIIPLLLSVPVFSDNVIICIFVSKLPFKREQAESFPRLSAFTNEKVQIGLVVDYHLFIIPSIKSF